MLLKDLVTHVHCIYVLVGLQVIEGQPVAWGWGGDVERRGVVARQGGDEFLTDCWIHVVAEGPCLLIVVSCILVCLFLL